jgi:hypothetical protein
MNCQDIRKQIPDLLTNDLGAGDTARLKEHLHSCSSCRQEWQELNETWTGLGILPEELPSPELRRNFYRALEAYRQDLAPGTGMDWRQKVGRLMSAWRFPIPTLRLAAAALIVLTGFAIGFITGAGGRRDAGKFERLNREVDRLQQQVSLSLLSQPSASARLQGLSMTSQLPHPDPALLSTLLDMLDNDPSVNVRLSAVDALFLFAERQEVRTALTASLSRQASPLVQIALIDLMVSFKEKKAAVALRRLLADEKILPEVRQRARSGISQIL